MVVWESTNMYLSDNLIQLCFKNLKIRFFNC